MVSSRATDTLATGQPAAGRRAFAEARQAAQDRRLATLLRIAGTLASQQKLETVLDQLLASLLETLDLAEAGALILYDVPAARLALGAAHGYPAAALGRLLPRVVKPSDHDSFLAGQVGLYLTPQAAAAALGGLFLAAHGTRSAVAGGEEGLRTAAAIPVRAGQEPLGMLLLENLRRPAAFVQEELPFLQDVADVMARAISNFHQLHQVQVALALEEANRLKAELISTLAHEMRTPLTSIKGFSSALLMEEFSFGLEAQREFLQFIDEECDVLEGLIRDLLESSIIDAGLLRLEPQPLRLIPLVQGIVDELSRRTSTHRFLIDFPPDFPLLDADPARVAQVLRNLLDNSVKYSPEGGLVVIRGQVQGDEVVISVADQGIGLAPEHLNRLFEKFFRAKSLLGHHVVGSGLGLPISRTIVEKHGGRIWAESQLGQGTTLYFTLPRQGMDAQEGEDD
jgi:signal transduction histidine kinase